MRKRPVACRPSGCEASPFWLDHQAPEPEGVSLLDLGSLVQLSRDLYHALSVKRDAKAQLDERLSTPQPELVSAPVLTWGFPAAPTGFEPVPPP